jgi:protein TonB
MVAIILAVVGYGFVTGLAYKYVKKASEKLDVFDVQEPPPPPEELPPPPPPPDTPVPPPPTTVVVPPSIVQVQVPSPAVFTTPVIPPSQPTSPPAPPAPPAPPPPPRVAKPLQPRGQPQSWVTNDDYPAAAMRSGDQGVTAVRLDVGPDGRVTDCTVTSSSGSSVLDSTACSLLRRRARFSPAEDAGGNKIAAAWSGRFRWTIPD